MSWKRVGDIIIGAIVIFMGVSGYGMAMVGDIQEAWILLVFLLFLWSSIRDDRHTKKLENTILEQESIILRTEYIRNKMLEEGLWK